MLSLVRLRCRARIRATHQGPSALSSEGRKRAHRATHNFPGTFQCVETLRKRTLFGPNTFPQRCVPHLWHRALSPLDHRPLTANFTKSLEPSISFDTDFPNTKAGVMSTPSSDSPLWHMSVKRQRSHKYLNSPMRHKLWALHKRII